MGYIKGINNIPGVNAHVFLRKAREFGLEIKKKEFYLSVYDKEGGLIALYMDLRDYELKDGKPNLVKIDHVYNVLDTEKMSEQGRQFISMLTEKERTDKIAAGKLYAITYYSVQEKIVEIEADSNDEALEKFYSGDYDFGKPKIRKVTNGYND